MTVTIIDGMEGVDDYLQEVAADFAAIDFSPALLHETERLEQLHTQYFNDEHGSDGRAWPDLAKSTVKRKGHDQILFETGRLEDSVRDSHSPDAIRQIDTTQDVQFLIFGSGVEYGEFHMTGTARMPARPFVGMSPIYVDQSAERVTDFALEALKR